MALKKSLADLAVEAQRVVDEIDTDELTEMLEAEEDERPLVIDVREPDERARGHIPGSIGIPRGVLERDIEAKAFGGAVSEGDLGRMVVCYCGGGQRSLLACRSLQELGFRDAVSLMGGFGAWGESGGAMTVERAG